MKRRVSSVYHGRRRTNEDSVDTTRFFPAQDETREKREQNAQTVEIVGDPSRTRTCNPRSRNPLLYPVELWDRCYGTVAMGPNRGLKG
jgi:hypothetical protein